MSNRFHICEPPFFTCPQLIQKGNLTGKRKKLVKTFSIPILVERYVMIVIESLSYLNLPTDDIEKSIEFYTNLLDFEVVESDEEQAVLSFDDNINIRLLKGGKAVSSEAIPAFSFLLDMDDFTDALQEIENSGIKIVAGPKEVKGGENLIIADPSGNVLELYYTE